VPGGGELQKKFTKEGLWLVRLSVNMRTWSEGFTSRVREKKYHKKKGQRSNAGSYRVRLTQRKVLGFVVKKKNRGKDIFEFKTFGRQKGRGTDG